jgi:AraC-like DNA-binding protein
MPSSAVHTFTDPDEYAAVFPATSADLTITGRGQFIANVTRIDLHRLWMLRFSDSLPRVKHSANITGRTIISFRTQHGPGLFCNGQEMHPGNIKQLGPGQSANQQSAGLASVGVMSLPVEDMASVGRAIAGIDLEPPRDPLIVAPPAPAMAKLQRLHATAAYLAENAPEIIGHHEAARGLEQALIEAMVACLTTADVAEDRAAQRRHDAIMRRFRTEVEENPEQPLYIPELCKAIGVSGRTLRVCCQEHLGMSPKQYLLLRRMHLARRTLRNSAPTATTVTEIAAQYGFWQFGRFAGEYKSLFGELPSTTLGLPRA